ncbi:MAG: hypothetical protein DWQ36_14490 [Acidobacteria bacterium]|nr:MAG: hypothetical protein DWQ30_03225 [Acidobacteriota bacterium]REK06100.1 MAG: hypothetical protein DWQ36_14490 [Acidobacteriota bacterium]
MLGSLRPSPLQFVAVRQTRDAWIPAFAGMTEREVGRRDLLLRPLPLQGEAGWGCPSNPVRSFFDSLRGRRLLLSALRLGSLALASAKGVSQ